MDGNGRWAKNVKCHVLKAIMKDANNQENYREASNIGIKYLTLYALLRIGLDLKAKLIIL